MFYQDVSVSHSSINRYMLGIIRITLVCYFYPPPQTNHHMFVISIPPPPNQSPHVSPVLLLKKYISFSVHGLRVFASENIKKTRVI